uniref:Uncharacterized protein n=1 Tax=Trypanosoma vivax (strain Y486) TaxID=1055687 RepID=G0U034_TRYVY|nr:hypothetical protein, unlikely [Trypanosoma vivax Y486]
MVWNGPNTQVKRRYLFAPSLNLTSPHLPPRRCDRLCCVILTLTWEKEKRSLAVTFLALTFPLVVLIHQSFHYPPASTRTNAAPVTFSITLKQGGYNQETSGTGA